MESEILCYKQHDGIHIGHIAEGGRVYVGENKNLHRQRERVELFTRVRNRYFPVRVSNNFCLFHSLLLHEKNGLSQCPSVTKFCEDLYAEGNRSTFLLALLVDMCEEQCSVMGSSGDGVYTLARAQELCTALASEYDTIRAKYWEHVASNIVQKCENSNGAS